MALAPLKQLQEALGGPRARAVMTVKRVAEAHRPRAAATAVTSGRPSAGWSLRRAERCCPMGWQNHGAVLLVVWEEGNPTRTSATWQGMVRRREAVALRLARQSAGAPIERGPLWAGGFAVLGPQLSPQGLQFCAYNLV